MGTPQEHREKREYALSIAYECIVGEFLTDIPVIENILLERIESNPPPAGLIIFTSLQMCMD